MYTDYVNRNQANCFFKFVSLSARKRNKQIKNILQLLKPKHIATDTINTDTINLEKVRWREYWNLTRSRFANSIGGYGSGMSVFMIDLSFRTHWSTPRLGSTQSFLYSAKEIASFSSRSSSLCTKMLFITFHKLLHEYMEYMINVMNVQHNKWRWNCFIVSIKSYKSYNSKITIKDLYNFNTIFMGWDFNCYKSLTFWIRGIRCAFWPRDSIDIFCSMLQRNRIKKLYKVQDWFLYHYEISFINTRTVNIINSLTSGDISCQFPFSVRVTCYTLVNTQHSTMVNIVMKQKKILMLR